MKMQEKKRSFNNSDLVEQFTKSVGKETLRFCVRRQLPGYLCERELIERDGSAFTQVLPFNSMSKVAAFIKSDPYYSAIKTEADRLLSKLHRELQDEPDLFA